MPGSLPKNVDTKTRQVEPSDQCELAANDEDDLIPAGMKIDGIFGRKLEDRISGLEQRLCEAGLLEKPEFESDSRKIPEEKGDSECPELPSPRNVLGSLVHANLSTGSPKNTTNQEDYLRVLVGRIDSLEKRLEEAGHLKTKAGLENHRMPAIPQLQYLQWSDFKNKLASKEETYAIEVLVGGAKYWYQQSEEDDNNRQRSDYHSNGHDESAIEVSNPAPSPERIRINSKPMLLIMKSIDPAGWNELPTVVLWPFKPLIYHEVRIREVFERLLSRWGNSPMEGIDSWRMRNEDTEDMTDSFEALQDLRCLLKFIDLELRPVVESFRGNTRKKVLFRDLWHLFKPGDLVYSPLGNRDPLERSIKDVRYQEVFRIVRTVGGRNLLGPSRDCDPKNNVSSLHVEVYWADFSGTQFVPQYTILTLLPYHGEREITSLGFYPLRYSPKADELQSKWKSRGEAFRDYTVFKYRYFTGKSLISSPDGGFANIPGDSHPKIAEIIDSQVVVDFGEAFAAHRAWRTDTSGPELKPADCYPEWTEKYPTSYWKDSDWKILDKKSDDRIYEDVIIDARLIEEWREQDPLLRKDPWTKSAGKVDFDKDYLILLPNRVFAFVMKSRKWCK